LLPDKPTELTDDRTLGGIMTKYEPRDRYDDDQQRTHRENRVVSMAAPRVRSSCSIKPEMVFLIRSQTLAIIR
jgi:hypothetical protein